MPMFANRYYDVRPVWPTWRWTAYRADLVTPIGNGAAANRAAAEADARACIRSHTSSPTPGALAPGAKASCNQFE